MQAVAKRLSGSAKKRKALPSPKAEPVQTLAAPLGAEPVEAVEAVEEVVARAVPPPQAKKSPWEALANALSFQCCVAPGREERSQ